MRFAAIVDHPQRDLLGLSLVSAHLATMNHRLDLVSADSASRHLTRGKFDLVLVNYVRDNNRRLLLRILAAGQKVVVLDTEGGVFETPVHFERTLSTDRELFGKLSCYLTWGDRTRDILVEGNYISSENVLATGQPRFDVYRDPYVNSMRSLAERRTRKLRPRVLVNFNYPIAQPRFGTPESELLALVERMSWPKEEAARLQSRQAEARIAMLSLVELVASQVPSIELAIRPHPFEHIGDYLKLTKRHTNVVFAGNSPIHDWIVSSDVVLQRGCTTAIEAWLAGSRAISPKWIDSDRDETIADKMSFEVQTSSDLVEICTTLGAQGSLPREVRGYQPSPQHVEKVVDWVGPCDGESARRVAIALDKAGDFAQTRTRRRRGSDELLRAAIPAKVKRLGRTKRLSALWDDAKVIRRSLIARDAAVIGVVSRDLRLSRRQPFYWRSAENLRSDLPKSAAEN